MVTGLSASDSPKTHSRMAERDKARSALDTHKQTGHTHTHTEIRTHIKHTSAKPNTGIHFAFTNSRLPDHSLIHSLMCTHTRTHAGFPVCQPARLPISRGAVWQGEERWGERHQFASSNALAAPTRHIDYFFPAKRQIAISGA